MPTAYCVKCKEKREMDDAKEVEMKGKGDTKRRALKGKCPVCGTGMFKILPSKKKDE
jgi:Zn finger protein HypA/HybF involved in hydrogenase expression